MSMLLHIRTNVLKITQAQMAAISGASQATVSRWESGDLEPDRRQLAAIRAEVKKLALPWDDRWFFEIPTPTDARAA